jgi:hypothetical protein
LNNLIALYEAWGKPEKAQEWRAKLPKAEAVSRVAAQLSTTGSMLTCSTAKDSEPTEKTEAKTKDKKKSG